MVSAVQFRPWPPAAAPYPGALSERRASKPGTLAAAACFRRYPEQPTRIRILQHPQRTVWTNFHVADAVTDVPAFCWFGAALAVEGDAIECLRCHAPHQRGTAPLRKHRAVVEHKIAGRDDWRPEDDGLGQVGPYVGAGNRHPVVVHRVRHERPAVILPGLGQI